MTLFKPKDNFTLKVQQPKLQEFAKVLLEFDELVKYNCLNLKLLVEAFPEYVEVLYEKMLPDFKIYTMNNVYSLNVLVNAFPHHAEDLYAMMLADFKRYAAKNFNLLKGLVVTFPNHNEELCETYKTEYNVSEIPDLNSLPAFEPLEISREDSQKNWYLSLQP